MVYIILGTGFEEIEAVAPMDILRRAGVEVRYAAVADKKVIGAHGIVITADCLLRDVDPAQAEAIVLPGGGVMTPGNYGSDPGALEFIKQYALAGKRVGAICAAPTVLGGLGLLEGRNAVCYPGMEAGLTGAKAMVGHKVVCDGSYVTAQGPGSALEFGLNLAAMLKGRQAAEAVRQGMHYPPITYVCG